MTLPSQQQKQFSCAEVAPLLELEILGEAIRPADEQILRSHLAACDSCADFRDLIQGLPAFAPTDSTKAFQDTVDAATEQYFSKNKKRRRWVVVGVAVAALLAIAVALWGYRTQTPAVDSSVQMAIGCEPADPTEVVSGVWMSHCKVDSPEVEIAKNGDLKIIVKEGAVGVSANPNRSDKGAISVQTVHGEVRVVGTVFTVQKEKADSRVEVFRGKVAVWPGGLPDGAFDVTQGMGAWFSTKMVYVLPREQKSELGEKMADVRYAENGSDSITSVEPPNEEVNSARSPTDSAVVPGEKSSKNSRRIATSVAPLDVLFQEARNCLLAKDWHCAAGKYQSILQHYDKRWESSSAYISLAKIELRHFKKPIQARKHYLVYQKRYPNGPLVEEAIFGMAECERHLGNEQNELRILQSFVQKHQNSALTIKANKRIAELQAGN